MKEYIKSYRVFASSLWIRGLLHVLYPVMVMFSTLGLIGVSLEMNDGIQMAYQLVGGMVIVVEVFFGYFIFGGIAAADTNKLEYLKTSVKGIPVLKKGLIVDAVRRWIRIILIEVIPLLISGEKMQPGVWMAVFITIAFTELGLLVVKNSTSFTIFIVITMAISMVSGIVLGMGVHYGANVWLLPIPFILAAVLMIFSIHQVLVAARRSFYDNRTKKELEVA